jgi:uncharacterized SAM-binding protein YcdF (DUF218 family)
MSYAQPLVLFFTIVGLVGLLRLGRCYRSLPAVLGMLGIVLLSWPPVEWLLSRPLETRYPLRPFRASAPFQAIVVLSSAIYSPRYGRPFPIPDTNTYERCELAAWIYKKSPSVPVLACGGPDAADHEPGSVMMREMLRRAGVPAAMIWTEERSRSTHENAFFGSEILRKNGIRTIALVVDAKSMLRAEACFRKQGIAVTPAPCGFREFGRLSEEFLPSWKAISRNEVTLHETAGLAWYWLRGWI